MKTPLAGAIEAVCRLANLEPKQTARILAAVEGEMKPVHDKLLTTKQARLRRCWDATRRPFLDMACRDGCILSGGVLA